MNSTLTLLVPLVVLAGVVFGVTLLSQYTPREEKEPTPGAASAAAAGGWPENEPALRFRSDMVGWDPTSDDLALKTFPGFFEPGGTLHHASFWFRNGNAVPVEIRARGVSCSACTSAELALLPATAPADVARASLLPLPLPFPTALPAAAGAKLLAGLQWQPFDFTDKDKGLVVPPGPDPKSPQRGVIRVAFTVRPPANSRTLSAYFAALPAGVPAATEYQLKIALTAAPAFEVAPDHLDFGQLSDTGGPWTKEVTVVSSTRDLDTFPPPDVSGANGAGDAVRVGAPAAVTGPAFAALAAEYASQSPPVRVRAAYKVPVTVGRPESGAFDLGPLDRQLWLSVPNSEPKRVLLTGVVAGDVRPLDGWAFDLGSFGIRADHSKAFTVRVGKPGVELALVPGESKPDFMKLSLERVPGSADVTDYRVRITVPAGQGAGELPADSMVVFERKGPNPLRLRVPVKGRGVFRN